MMYHGGIQLIANDVHVLNQYITFMSLDFIAIVS